MSKRKIDNTLLYGILTALVLFCAVALGFSEWGHNLPEAQARDYESSPYAESANRRIDSTCVGMSGVSLAECIIEIEQSERSNYRAEQDLYAQRYMMVWAFFMTLASFLTAGIAAVGLYWIRATLIETREAVRAADDAVAVTREIGQAQVRAYITFESVNMRAKVVGNNVELTFEVKIRNSGQSPARIVKTFAQTPQEVSDTFYFRDLASGETDIQEMMIIHDVSRLHFIENSSILFAGAVEIFVSFDDVFSHTTRATEKSFFMGVFDLGISEGFQPMQQVGEFEYIDGIIKEKGS